MGSHLHCGGGGPVPAFSALHLLRSYNHLLSQPVEAARPYQQLVSPEAACCPEAAVAAAAARDGAAVAAAVAAPFAALPPPGLVPHGLLGAMQPYTPLLPLVPDHAACTLLARALPSSPGKRPRSEKKPIPDEQKDEKYFERRKRNNQAAKKSRDARKIREDQVALRAAFLEQENAFLRTQVITLREETQALRHLLLQRKVEETPHISSIP